MFERRLKIFLTILLVVTGVMVARAVQLQVFGRDYWREQAAESMRKSRLVETTRGAILDVTGHPIALDVACIDAAVDYRAIVEPPDPQWVTNQAIARVRRELGDSYWKVSGDERRKRIADQQQTVRDDLGGMWRALAAEMARAAKRDSNRPPTPAELTAAMERIDDARRAIVERVRMRRRYVWYQKYLQAVEQQKGIATPWYSKWLLEDTGEGPDVDNFIEDVGEQEAAHPILHNIDNDTLINLKKSRHKYPGLAFIDSTDRHYPYGSAAAHVLGRLSKVKYEDILADPNLGKDELREYQKNDMIGRMGLEALCEPALRGTRGQVVRAVGDAAEVSRIDSVPGRDVRTTLDIRLQQQIERLFTKVQIANHDKTLQVLEMHGAAVVIDVPSGAVRALASWPTYDANEFDARYDQMSTDDLNQPLLNRATQWAIEPGSTVKPIVGLGAITDGLCGATDGIECTGYLTLRGHTFRTHHRCWVARMYAATHGYEGIKHHAIPTHTPHRGHSGNPDGFLTLSDAIERSCNVYFETLADKMGIHGLNKWFRAFGLGRLTGVGIAESRGWVPNPAGMSRRHILGDTWNAGIGQGQVGATALQMANVAATVARDGVWIRPYLVADPSTPTTRPARLTPDGPDRVDLKLSPAALLAAKKGMHDVVYSNAGTAGDFMPTEVKVAGKTGSAQAAKFRTPLRDARGDLMYECAKCAAPIEKLEQKQCPVCQNTRRRVRRQEHEPASHLNPNGPIPWYRGFGEDGKTLSHAWFIGFAPTENPQIAFAVMVEYGGSGGAAAAHVADGLIKACLERGYLKRSGAPVVADVAP